MPTPKGLMCYATKLLPVGRTAALSEPSGLGEYCIMTDIEC